MSRSLRSLANYYIYISREISIEHPSVGLASLTQSREISIEHPSVGLASLAQLYMFRTDAQLCPVTQPVIPLHNRPPRYPTGSDKQEILYQRRYSSLASGAILICLGVQKIWQPSTPLPNLLRQTRDTLPAEILFTGEWCYPYLLGCAEDLAVWV